MNLSHLENILKQFVSHNVGIEDAVLVSRDAELVTSPLQSANPAEVFTGMAVAMFQLSAGTRQHLRWQQLEQMWLQSGSSHFIGIHCSQDILILIQASGYVTLGGLRIAINRLVKEVQLEIENTTPLTTASTEKFNFRKSIFARLDSDILSGKESTQTIPKQKNIKPSTPQPSPRYQQQEKPPEPQGNKRKKRPLIG